MSERAIRFYQKMKLLLDGADITGDKSSVDAAAFLDALAGNGSDKDLPRPFKDSVDILHDEFDKAVISSRKEAFENLEYLLENADMDGVESKEKVAETLWAAFFPEALHLSHNPEDQIRLLREKRIIHIDTPAANPVQEPVKEILFTSNVLLSPPVSESTDGVQNNDEISRVISGAVNAGKGKQLYWYDHPIPIGTALENDEAVYGLSGLAKALEFEKKRGNAGADDRMSVMLSVSVTHPDLHDWA
ncbi:MAG: hypothetical protein KAH21_02355, partial [Spirochaetaceae bacterium]|nr:hypothetical protein [Spirochaetaceae bacterium]